VHAAFDAEGKKRNAAESSAGSGGTSDTRTLTPEPTTAVSEPTHATDASGATPKIAGKRKWASNIGANVVASMSLAMVIVGTVVLSDMHRENGSGDVGVAVDSEQAMGPNVTALISNSFNETSQLAGLVHTEGFELSTGARITAVVLGLLLLVGIAAMYRPARFSVLTKTCGMASRPMLTVVVTYGASLVVQLILALLVHAIESDAWSKQIGEDGEFAFHQSVFFVLTTFVGGGYGDVYPVTTAGRAIITLVSTCGFVLQLFHIVLVVQTALNHAAQDNTGHKPSAFSKFKLLLPLYAAAACVALVLGLLMHATDGLNVPEGDCAHSSAGCHLMDSLYLLWMTTHRITFGEIIPGNFAGRLITWLAMLINYILIIGFAALAAIPNQGSYNFINIPLLHGISGSSLP
jgi:hypothetical protein